MVLSMGFWVRIPTQHFTPKLHFQALNWIWWRGKLRKWKGDTGDNKTGERAEREEYVVHLVNAVGNSSSILPGPSEKLYTTYPRIICLRNRRGSISLPAPCPLIKGSLPTLVGCTYEWFSTAISLTLNVRGPSVVCGVAEVRHCQI